LVNLYASLLESVTIPTAFVDVPGHIFLMFQVEDTGEPALGFPPDRVIDIDGDKWIPVEATAVGQNFDDAWQGGLRKWRTAQTDGTARVIKVHEAWAKYQPATLPETPTIDGPAKDKITAKYGPDFKKVEDLRLATLKNFYLNKIKTNPKDEESHVQLGLALAEHKKLGEAGDWFGKALKINGQNAAALNNLANVYYLQGDMMKSVDAYQKAVAVDGSDGGIWLNLARAQWKADYKDAAEKSFKKALSLNPELKKQYKSVEEAF
jgi:tetratricopeptide (TPR) repeat protein